MNGLYSHLPKLSTSALVASPRTALTQWLHGMKPIVPVTRIRYQSGALPQRDCLWHFEFLCEDWSRGGRAFFRTGTLTVSWAYRTHEVTYAGWSPVYINADDHHVPLRPLWLPGQLWFLIPEDVKLKDVNYLDDPFDGFADFKPLDGFGFEGMF